MKTGEKTKRFERNEKRDKKIIWHNIGQNVKISKIKKDNIIIPRTK